MKPARVGEGIIGNKIVEPVFTFNGNMLLNRGTIVNSKVLKKLMGHNINFVYVIEDIKKDIIPINTLEEKRIARAESTIKKVFLDTLHNEKLGVKTLIPEGNLILVEKIIDSILKDLSDSKDILFTLSDLIDTDEYTYKHSINVTVLTILTANSLNYKKNDIKNIALGALLHDIGKIMVKDNLIAKPGKLTEDERNEVMKHSEFGFQIVDSIEKLSFTTKQIIRLHHEKLDGSGYPLGLKGIEIPEYVRIVTICDMFDAMSTNRVYRDKMSIYKVFDILNGESIYRIDTEIYKAVITNICVFPPGSGVILTDDRMGIVANYNRFNPTRPRVRVINTNSNLLKVEIVNLEKELKLFIKDKWDVDEYLEEIRRRKIRNKKILKTNSYIS
ncbi:HD-GYP domain-containing protein [Helicovermis profundi]|uniref:HD-GYP domain-containing protein n=1 Tax=Helicovermis profundi TaxID=3065157 RepID=A0AAU9EM06_9FIRM|nr:HD-GYP domain-containing protein [Clostridia bacterium S502]